MKKLKSQKVFIIEKDEYTSHADTIKKAINDVEFKIMQQNFNVEEIVEKVKEKGFFTVYDYRLITGACEKGCNDFLDSNNINQETMPINEVIELTENSFGGNLIKELFS